MQRSGTRRGTALLLGLAMTASLVAFAPSASADVEPAGPITFTLTGGEIVIAGGNVLDPIELGPCELDPVAFPDPNDDPCDPDADPAELAGVIDSDGNVTIAAGDVVFPELEVDDPIAVTVRISAADDVTGVIDPLEGTMSMELELLIDLEFATADCVINLPMNLVGTYDPGASVGDITDDTFAIPALDCGPGNESIAAFLGDIVGLPSASNNSANLVFDVDPAISAVIPEGPPVVDDTSASMGLGGSATRTISALSNPAQTCVIDGGGDLALSVTLGTAPNGSWTITYVHDADAGPGSDTVDYTCENDQGDDSGTLSVFISGNECIAGEPGEPTGLGCSLDQFIELEILGDVLSMEQQESLVGLEDITLNGAPQVTNGDLNQITVINRRGDGEAWDVVGRVTDFKVVGSEVGDCPSTNPSSWDFRCIPGDNLGWYPAAVVAHHVVPGDVAAVSAGSDITWETISAGGAIGAGLGSADQLLCGAAETVSGGSFACTAGLALVVPASASAGTYAATITLTLS